MRSRQEIIDAVETQVKKYPNVRGVVEASVLTAILDVLFDLREQNEKIIAALEVKR